MPYTLMDAIEAVRTRAAVAGITPGDSAVDFEAMSCSTRSSISFDAGGVSKVRRFGQASATIRRKNRRRMGNAREIDSALMKEREKFTHIQVFGGARKQRKIKDNAKFADMDPVMQTLVEQCPEVMPDHLNPAQYTMFLPCDRAQMHHLKYFDRAPRTLSEQSAPLWNRAVKLMRAVCQPERLGRMPTLEDLKDVPYDANKYAGYEYACMGMRTRGEANTQALADAEDAFLLLTEGKDVIPHAVRMGGRGKLVKVTREQAEKEDLAKGRLILMLSSRDLKILGATEKVATELAKDEDIPVWVGNSFFFGGATRLARHLAGFRKFFCFDAEKYDSSLDPYMVDMAIDTLRSWFADGWDAEWDAYWRFVRNSLLDSVIVRDDGIIFAKSVGTTSGHSHNTLLQSLITIALGYALIIVTNPEASDEEILQHSFVAGLGDDNLIAIGGPLTDFTADEGAAIIEHFFAIKWGGNKSFATNRVVDPIDNFEENDVAGEFEGIQFLGKYFKVEMYDDEGEEVQVVVPYRPADETIIRALFPERKPSARALEMFTEAQLTYQRLAGLYIDNAANHLAAWFLNRAMDWLEAHGVISEATMDYKMGLKLLGDNNQDMDKEIRLRRFSREDWYDLVLCSKKDAYARQGEPRQESLRASDTFADYDPLLS